VHVNNSKVKDDWRKFAVRVGINQSDDNIVTDINDRKNVTGAGINNARRIMDLADGGQILVSSTVYENLHPRKQYYHAFGQELKKEAKHGLVLKMHQLIKPHNVNWLDINPPSSLVSPPKPVEPEPKLTKKVAYYFAHSIKNRDFLLRNRGGGQNNYALALLLWYLAVDSVGESESTEVNPYEGHMPETEHNTLGEQFQVLMELPFWVCADIRSLIHDVEIGLDKAKYFEDGWDFTIVNVEGRKKLKSEWSEIWEGFGLGELPDQ